MSTEAMNLALEALKDCRRDPRLKYEHKFHDKVIKALEEALAKQEQSEPFGWYDMEHGEIRDVEWTRQKPTYEGVWRPLYTTPQPAQKPLTDEQISNLWCEVTDTDFVTIDTHEFARAIEAAHGIKE